MEDKKLNAVAEARHTECPPDRGTSRAVSSPPSSGRAGAARAKKGSLGVREGSPLVSNGGVGKRLLNVGEAAQYLGLQVETVYKKARLRELPYVKVGGALRFDVEALGRFIAEHTVETID